MAEKSNKKLSSRQWAGIAAGVGIVVFAVFYFAQSGKAEQFVSGNVDPAYSAYVSSYSAGVLSTQSTIRIKLAKNVADSSKIGGPAERGLFAFEPGVDGQATWIDQQTLEFTPKEPFSQGTSYQVRFYLDRLFEIPEELAVFQYGFQTIAQNFEYDIENLKTPDPTNLKAQELVGLLKFADMAEASEVSKILSATQEGEELGVVWTALDDRTHRFSVADIDRGDTQGAVLLHFSGAPLGIEKEEEIKVEVPALGEFKLLEAKVVQGPGQYVILRFSDPLKEKQNLAGLIGIQNLYDLDFDIRDNKILVYPPVRQTGKKTLTIQSGIRNVLDYRMQEPTRVDLVFEQIKPAVRFTSKGNILPGTKGLVLPFEAVSLKAVDVEVIKIYEDNIPQFLQVNQMDGSQELRRVGKPVLRKTINLQNTGITDVSRWNRYTLDLGEMISQEPGAIYQVRIGFRQQHAAYYCGEATEEENMVSLESDDWDTPQSNEFSYWDSYEYYYYNPDYDWNERDNPCHVSYYSRERTIRKNIMASNLGVILKRGNDGSVVVFANDLKSTAPLQGVSLILTDFQRQVLAEGETDSDGKFTFQPDRKPFLLLASYQGQKAYLKLDDGSSLSMSNFDVAGERIQQGIKGFLYGDRGVWRPGDSLHLTFLMEDLNDLLPDNHPVVFELFNPKGQVDHRMVKVDGVNGFYNFSTATAPDAITGNWLAKVKVGGATFNKSLRIETVKPNRLKINLDFGVERITHEQNNVSGTLLVNWLHGAPARNLKAVFEVVLSETRTQFDRYQDYAFDDPARKFYAESQKIFEGYLDENGKAFINAGLSAEEASPGALNAHFKGRVFEEGGNFSIDRFTVPYYPYSSFVGVKVPKGDKARGMLLTDTTHVIEIATVDSEGKPVSRRAVDMEVYKLGWRWWWDSSDEYLGNYVGRSYNQPIQRGKINTREGKGKWRFRINYPEWGRYFVRACDPVSGHCSGKILYVDWPGWAGRGQRENPGGAAMLSFSAEKEKYQVGEEVKINIPSGGQGRALVSVENGSRVINTYWVNAQKGEIPFSFPTTAEMAPNIYVHVSLLQEHSQTINDLPIRLYGVIPIEVEDPDTKLEPVLRMKDVLAPNEETVIEVSEANNRLMSYTVALVDEGLLDLTRFKTPDPHRKFYAREALGVKTWDQYEYVMGAYGGRIERLLAIGGDGESLEETEPRVNRFKPVVKYFGPYTLEAGEVNVHKFTMPNYIGSVRTMVIAGHEGAYGRAEKAAPVRQSLMVLGTLPRVLGPEETVKLPVTVFAQDNSVKDVRVEIKASEIFDIVGATTKSIKFKAAGEQVLEFELGVKPMLGAGKVEILATSGGKTSSYPIEIEVRNPNPPVTTVQDAIVEAGESWQINFEPPGMKGTNSATIEVSNIPPINLSKRLKYLLSYPHGCLEQTVSGAFPQLYLDQVKTLEGGEQMKIDENIKGAIQRVKSMQRSDGGFVYWSGAEEANSWSTTYAGHFLLEAQQKGYSVPNDVLRKWKRFQRRRASAWRKVPSYSRSDLLQAYRLYTLALSGAPDYASMNRLREQQNLSVQGAWRLAAAYAKAGQPEAAENIVNGLTTDIREYKEMGYTYGSAHRDKAMILETLGLMGKTKEGLELLKQISSALSNDSYWMSTQTTAYCLIAVTSFVGEQDRSSQINFTYQVNNQSEVKATTALPLAQVDLENDVEGSLKLDNQSSGVLYVRLIQEGMPSRDEEPEVEENLRLQVVYTNAAGELIDPGRLIQGSDFYAEITITNPGLRGRYQDLALTQIFPSGWEIHNTRMDQQEDFHQLSTPEYQDIRDDRVYTYFSLQPNEQKKFRILLNASYAGDYYLPAVSCVAMYDNAIRAVRPGKVVKVIQGGRTVQ